MNQQDIQSRWAECKVRAQQRWSRLTPHECTEIGGNFDKLATKVQISYDVTPAEATRQVDEFAKTLRLDDQGRNTHPVGAARLGVPESFPLPTTFEVAASYDPLPTTSSPPVWQSPQSQPTLEQLAQARDTRKPVDPSNPSPPSKGPAERNPPGTIPGEERETQLEGASQPRDAGPSSDSAFADPAVTSDVAPESTSSTSSASE